MADAHEPSILSPGAVVANKFRIERLLGQGGMGRVYQALHLRLQQRVALKVLRPDKGASPELLTRFEREVRAAARLRSPYVVRVLDADTTPEGLTYLAMELLEGNDLAVELERRQLAVGEIVDWIVEACAGVAEAHAAGIVHRDIKPSNILLADERGERVAKVVDFGVSKLTGGDETGAAEETGGAIGTPRYMSPEQLRGVRDVDARTDVWSLGVVLYRALTGRFPFDADSDAAMAVAIATERPVPIDSLRDDLPIELANAIMRCLERYPGDRWKSALDFARAIHPFGTGRVASTALAPPRAPRSESSPLAPAAPDGPGATRRLSNDASTGELGSASTIGAPRTRRSPGVGGDAASTPTRRRRGWKRAALIAAGGSVVALVASFVAARVWRSDASRSHAAAAPSAGPPARPPLAPAGCELHADPGAEDDPSTLWIGVLAPLSGSEADAFGRATVNAIELARRDFASIAGGLPSRSGGATRPLGLVACDDSHRPLEAARHLVDVVGAPAIIGFGRSKDAVELSSSLLLPRGVLTISALNTSPLVTAVPQPPGGPRLVWRTTASARTWAAPIARVVSDVLEPALRVRRRALRVALVRTNNVSGLGFADELFKTLRIDGAPVAQHPDAFQQVLFEDPAVEGASPDYGAVVAELLRYEPDVVLYMDGDFFTENVLPPLEERWPARAARPYYVSMGVPKDEPLLRFVGSSAERRRRFLGVDLPANTAANIQFATRYDEFFTPKVTPATAPSSAYDAFYVIAYAAFAADAPHLDGVTLARALPSLHGDGPHVDVGPARIFEALAALRSRGAIDLDGAATTLDFDPETGEADPDFAVYCIKPDARGVAIDGVESGATFRAATRRLEGDVRCP